MTSHWRTSRFAPSELTFGALGRVVATILFLSPVYFALDLAGVFGIFFALPYLTMVVPEGLRWLWQPAPVELVADPLPAAVLQAEPPPAAGGIAGRQAPSRW
ncbi:MAG TPA: hypothetical protein VIJ31_00805 [Acidothermaceae bacterium]